MQVDHPAGTSSLKALHHIELCLADPGGPDRNPSGIGGTRRPRTPARPRISARPWWRAGSSSVTAASAAYAPTVVGYERSLSCAARYVLIASGSSSHDVAMPSLRSTAGPIWLHVRFPQGRVKKKGQTEFMRVLDSPSGNLPR